MKRYLAGGLAAIWTAGMMLTGYSEPLPQAAVQTINTGSQLIASTPGIYVEDETGATISPEPETGSKAGIPIVYTSMDKEKGKYTKKIKALFSGLWEHTGDH